MLVKDHQQQQQQQQHRPEFNKYGKPIAMPNMTAVSMIHSASEGTAG